MGVVWEAPNAPLLWVAVQRAHREQNAKGKNGKEKTENER
jgi:hypothetical protein